MFGTPFRQVGGGPVLVRTSKLGEQPTVEMAKGGRVPSACLRGGWRHEGVGLQKKSGDQTGAKTLSKRGKNGSKRAKCEEVRQVDRGGGSRIGIKRST